MHLLIPLEALLFVIGVLLLLPSLWLAAEIALSVSQSIRSHATSSVPQWQASRGSAGAQRGTDYCVDPAIHPRSAARPGDRLLVVADNCSDETAAVAAAEGAEVLVRTDALRRGKGYALDFAVRVLASSAPAMVLVIDADCQVAPDAIEQPRSACAAVGRPGTSPAIA